MAGKKFVPKPVATAPAPVVPAMPLAAAPPAPAAPMAAMKPPAAMEMPKGVRDAASKGIDQSLAAYNHIKSVTETTAQSVEASYTAAVKGSAELSAKAMAAMQANAHAAFDFMSALSSTKSLPDALKLQSEFMQKQSQALIAQGKEMAELAKKIAADSSEPLKAGMTKATKIG